MGAAAILPALSLGLGAVTTFAQIGAARSAASAQADAANRNAQLQYAELTRQQADLGRQAAEHKADVVRRANQELGSLRAVLGDMGISGASASALVGSIGGAEGTNLARIEAARRAQSDSLQASKDAARVGYTSVVRDAYAKSQANTLGALGNLAGSGLQIGAQMYGRQQALKQQQAIYDADLELRRGRNELWE